MPAFDDYTPEEMEPHNRELAALLEYLYQLPTVAQNIAVAEQEHILVRARARLLTTELTSDDEKETAHLPLTPFDSTRPTDHVPQPARPTRTHHTLRLQRVFNATAAVLVVCALIAASALLFTRHPSNTVSPARSSHSLPCFLKMDDGLAYVCQHHLYQNPNLSKDTGPYRVVLTQAYADRNRVALGFETEKLVQGQYIPSSEIDVGEQRLTNSQGVPFPAIGGAGEGLGIAGAAGNEDVFLYATPATLSVSSTLNLHLKVQTVPGPASHITGVIPASDIHTLIFDFSLPLRPELRLSMINQTMRANDLPMTIKDVRVSLSEVVFDAVYTPEKNKPMPVSANLFVGGFHCSDIGNGQIMFTRLDVPQVVSPSARLILGCSLFNVHGSARLIIKNDWAGKISWTFHFTIP